MLLTRRSLVVGAGAMLAARSARAEGSWPDRAVRLVAATPPAGASDILTRTLALALQVQTGQSFVVDNRPGAGGVIGSDYVAKSAPDGYTWLTTNVGSHAINVTLNPHLPYDAKNDFRNVTTIGRLPVVMLVNNDLPATTLGEFVALARAKPGRLNFGSGGNGTLLHLTGELLKRSAGIDIVHVPYRGAQAATQDLIGGRIESMFDSMPSAAPHLRAGTVRAIAVSGARRSDTFPQIPTIVEQGFDVVTTNWFGLAGPARVPDDIVARMYAEAARALASPDLRGRFGDIGVEPGGEPPAEAQAFVLAEIERWAGVVRATGVTVN